MSEGSLEGGLRVMRGDEVEDGDSIEGDRESVGKTLASDIKNARILSIEM